jgi:DDE family transposase
MYSDTERREVQDQLREHDLRVFAKLLTTGVFVEAAGRCNLRLWSCPLNLANLAWLGISAAWRKPESFVTILTVTLKLLQDQEHFAQSALGKDLASKQRRFQEKRGRKNKKEKASKHEPHGKDPTCVTEEAFAKARQRMPLTFWIAVIAVLSERFEAQHAERLRFRGFRLLAIDGTRLTLPDEQALRTFYGTASNGKGQHNAQARMVLLQSPLTRMPVAYELQPVKVGEITMARQLARTHLRRDDLILLDSGYVSYGLLWDIHRRGAFFCIRMQRAMNMHTLRRDPRTGERWVRWTPKDSRGQWRREGLERSIDLRLIEYQIPGYRRIQLLTNVLSSQKLSHADFCRLTTQPGAAETLLPGLYHMRWQIETSFAEMKIGQQMEGGFRSRTPAGIGFEVAGHVVLYLLVRWLIVEAAVEHDVDPLRISFCNALRELRQLWPTIVTSSPRWVAKVLLPRLLERIASHLVPLRPGRSYMRKKKAKGKTATSKRKKS